MHISSTVMNYGVSESIRLAYTAEVNLREQIAQEENYHQINQADYIDSIPNELLEEEIDDAYDEQIQR